MENKDLNSIIFLDIDGVLNSANHFKKTYKEKNNEDNYIKKRLLEIDNKKIELLKVIVQETSSKIVITSSWRILGIYKEIKKELINQGLPIIGETQYFGGQRGSEIRDYLKNNNVDNFIIIDDEVFKDFYELENYLIKTSFYIDGLEEHHVKEAIKRLKK